MMQIDVDRVSVLIRFDFSCLKNQLVRLILKGFAIASICIFFAWPLGGLIGRRGSGQW